MRVHDCTRGVPRVGTVEPLERVDGGTLVVGLTGRSGLHRLSPARGATLQSAVWAVRTFDMM